MKIKELNDLLIYQSENSDIKIEVIAQNEGNEKRYILVKGEFNYE